MTSQVNKLHTKHKQSAACLSPLRGRCVHRMSCPPRSSFISLWAVQAWCDRSRRQGWGGLRGHNLPQASDTPETTAQCSWPTLASRTARLLEGEVVTWILGRMSPVCCRGLQQARTQSHGAESWAMQVDWELCTGCRELSYIQRRADELRWIPSGVCANVSMGGPQ